MPSIENSFNNLMQNFIEIEKSQGLDSKEARNLFKQASTKKIIKEAMNALTTKNSDVQALNKKAIHILKFTQLRGKGVSRILNQIFGFNRRAIKKIVSNAVLEKHNIEKLDTEGFLAKLSSTLNAIKQIPHEKEKLESAKAEALALMNIYASGGLRRSQYTKLSLEQIGSLADLGLLEKTQVMKEYIKRFPKPARFQAVIELNNDNSETIKLLHELKVTLPSHPGGVDADKLVTLWNAASELDDTAKTAMQKKIASSLKKITKASDDQYKPAIIKTAIEKAGMEHDLTKAVFSQIPKKQVDSLLQKSQLTHDQFMNASALYGPPSKTETAEETI